MPYDRADPIMNEEITREIFKTPEYKALSPKDKRYVRKMVSEYEKLGVKTLNEYADYFDSKRGY